MAETKIEWARNADGSKGQTWNPFRGCVKVSPGCKHCYAETFAERWRGIAGHPYEQGFDPRFVPEALGIPLRTKKPTTFFVNSMSDLFFEGFTNEQIAAVFGVMAACPQHTFQVLTKRAERLPKWFAWIEEQGKLLPELVGEVAPEGTALEAAACTMMVSQSSQEKDLLGAALFMAGVHSKHWPLPNVWLGVSVENQKYADERVPLLLQVPAAVRFISAEPLLGPVSLERWIQRIDHCTSCGEENAPQEKDICPSCGSTAGLIATWGDEQAATFRAGTRYEEGPDLDDGPPLHWCIIGGESGRGARPFDLAWARTVRDECQESGVPYFFKQAGSLAVDSDRLCGSFADSDKRSIRAAKALGCEDNPPNLVVLRKKGGDLTQLPEDLRIREFPQVSP